MSAIHKLHEKNFSDRTAVERCILELDEANDYVYDLTATAAAEYARLRSDLADAVAMLKRLEWTEGRYSYVCQVCGSDEHKGHKPDCELAALLKRLE